MDKKTEYILSQALLIATASPGIPGGPNAGVNCSERIFNDEDKPNVERKIKHLRHALEAQNEFRF